jgi:predicted transcriptional regulator
MQINLPDDLTQRVKRRTAGTVGTTEVDVIRQSLDALDWQDSERAAVQEGIDAMNEGRVQDFDQFDREFREKNGVPSDD